jgi:predicted nucleic acid-binding protein
VKKLYFDSSYLFRMYSQEPGHEAVKALLPGCDQIVSAWHARAEIASIVLRHRRERATPSPLLEELHQQFLDEHHAGHVVLLSLDEAGTLRLEDVLRKAPSDTYVRAVDAMHLACAAEYGFKEVYSNDHHFLAAAPLFGMRGINVIGGGTGTLR